MIRMTTMTIMLSAMVACRCGSSRPSDTMPERPTAVGQMDAAAMTTSDTAPAPPMANDGAPAAPANASTCDPTAVSSKLVVLGYRGDATPEWAALDAARETDAGIELLVTSIEKRVNDRVNSPFNGQPDTTIVGTFSIGGSTVIGSIAFVGYPNDALKVAAGDRLRVRSRSVIREDEDGHPFDNSVVTIRTSAGELLLASVHNVTELRAGEPPLWPSPLLPEVNVETVRDPTCVISDPALSGPAEAMVLRVRTATTEVLVPNNATRTAGDLLVSSANAEHGRDGDVLHPYGRAVLWSLFVANKRLLGM